MLSLLPLKSHDLPTFVGLRRTYWYSGAVSTHHCYAFWWFWLKGIVGYQTPLSSKSVQLVEVPNICSLIFKTINKFHTDTTHIDVPEMLEMLAFGPRPLLVLSFNVIHLWLTLAQKEY